MTPIEPDHRLPEHSPRAWCWRPPAFLCGLALIFAGLYAAGSRIYLKWPVEGDRDMLATMSHRHALLLGSSHGHAVIPSEAGLDGVDLAQGNEDLFEMAYMARTVEARAPKLDLVMIALSYFSFSFDNAAYEEKGVRTMIGRRIRLYSTFHRLGFIPGDSAEYMKGLLWPVVTSDHYETAFQTLFSHVADAFRPAKKAEPVAKAAETLESPEATETPAPQDPHKTPAWFGGHAHTRCRHYAHLTKVMRNKHPGLEADTERQMLELARELAAKHVRVVFFTPPYTRAYSACFEPRLQRLTRDTGRELARETGAQYLDFSTDPDFIDRLDYFADSDHLGDSGKKAFSRLFAAALAQKTSP